MEHYLLFKENVTSELNLNNNWSTTNTHTPFNQVYIERRHNSRSEQHTISRHVRNSFDHWWCTQFGWRLFCSRFSKHKQKLQITVQFTKAHAQTNFEKIHWILHENRMLFTLSIEHWAGTIERLELIILVLNKCKAFYFRLNRNCHMFIAKKISDLLSRMDGKANFDPFVFLKRIKDRCGTF